MRTFLLAALVGLVGCTQILGDDFTIGDPGSGGNTSSAGAHPGVGGGGGAQGGAGGTGGVLPTFDLVWQERVGGDGEQLLLDLARDGNDQVGMVGTFEVTLPLDTTHTSNSTLGDGFVAKTDDAGQVVWSRQFSGGPGNIVRPQGMAFDSTGAAYITGLFTSTTDFGSGPTSSNGAEDGFIAKYDVNGGFQFAKVLGGQSGDDQGVAVATSGNRLFAVGEWVSFIDIDGQSHSSAAARNIYLASFQLNGNVLETRTWPSQGSHFISDVATDADGNVIIVGTYDFAANFGGDIHNPAGSELAMYVAKFTPDLSLEWSRSFSSTEGPVQPHRICTQGSRIAITGRYRGAIDFGGGTVPHQGGDDAFALVLDGAGSYFHAITLTGAADEGFGDCTFLPGDRLGIMGSFASVVDTGVGTISPVGPNDHVFLVYAAQGTSPSFVRQLPGDGNAIQPHIEATSDGGVILGSSPLGSHSFGGMVLPSTNGRDFVYAKLR